MSDPIFTFYVDMDGVLAKYDYNMYLPGIDREDLFAGREALIRLSNKNAPGKLAKYQIPNEHVYRDLPGDATMIAIFNALYHDPDRKCKVLTGLGCPYLISEQTLDKLWWCHSHLDGFDNKDFLCTYGSKDSAVTHLKNLTATDVLIDDYNRNLDDWRNAGGTAIKYVNGINSARSDMFCLFYVEEPSENVRRLDEYLGTLRA